MSIKEQVIALISSYTSNEELIESLWSEIETAYTEPHRHYHTLQHLDNLLLQLQVIKHEIQDWNTCLFTLFYHDAIYDPQQADNEEQSAKLAKERMTQLGLPKAQIDLCEAQILATKTHHFSTNSDTNYFTDADLSILGQSWENYQTYFHQVRQEYSIYPDAIYQAGRQKVLEHFLAMERIFKTDVFFTQFEIKAKENIKLELLSLQ